MKNNGDNLIRHSETKWKNLEILPKTGTPLEIRTREKSSLYVFICSSLTCQTSFSTCNLEQPANKVEKPLAEVS